jgi:hypothetical protein
MRLPLIHPTNLDTVKRERYDDMRAGTVVGFNAFRTALEDGAMIGLWNASLHHPVIGKAGWELTKAVNAMDKLPRIVKEVANRRRGVWRPGGSTAHPSRWHLCICVDDPQRLRCARAGE